jgi:hypothetical protein
MECLLKCKSDVLQSACEAVCPLYLRGHAEGMRCFSGFCCQLDYSQVTGNVELFTEVSCGRSEKK